MGATFFLQSISQSNYTKGGFFNMIVAMVHHSFFNAYHTCFRFSPFTWQFRTIGYESKQNESECYNEKKSQNNLNQR
jgi:hypothetical protein